jgi:hypothetical protein
MFFHQREVSDDTSHVLFNLQSTSTEDYTWMFFLCKSLHKQSSEIVVIINGPLDKLSDMLFLGHNKVMKFEQTPDLNKLKKERMEAKEWKKVEDRTLGEILKGRDKIPYIGKDGNEGTYTIDNLEGMSMNELNSIRQHIVDNDGTPEDLTNIDNYIAERKSDKNNENLTQNAA